MPFDLPEDPDWGQEYFSGIFIVFNEAVLKDDVSDIIKNATDTVCKDVCFLSFSRFENGDFIDLDIEAEIKEKSSENLKSYFYHHVKATLISNALGADRHAEAMSKVKYNFAFAMTGYGGNNIKLAKNIEGKVRQVKRAVSI